MFEKLSQVTFPTKTMETSILIPDQNSKPFALVDNALTDYADNAF